MKYENAIKYIYSRELFGIKLGLKNISELMESFDNPQLDYKTIHVAGTNGKGSTCSFISSILEKQGYKVGIYTSPHLVDFRERIKVNGNMISKRSVVSILKKIKPRIKDHTFFEVVTAIAFIYFKQQNVDFAVFEVGMGGRLDATNIINPEVAVITNISFDHVQHLGDTIEKIAFEKAGIIKPYAEVVTSEDCKSMKVIRNACKKKKCRLNIVKPKRIRSSLHGDFQYQNISLALKTIDVLIKKGFNISNNAIKKGLDEARWPGRFDFVSENTVFDCAHNISGARALAKELKKMKKDIYLILGIMKDKDIRGICSALAPLAEEIIITRPKTARAAMPGRIAGFIKRKVVAVSSVEDALEYARYKAGKKGLVVLTGSIFTVGEAFSVISKPSDKKID